MSSQSMAPSPLQAQWLHTAPQPVAVRAAAVPPVAQSLACSQGFGCAGTVLSGKMFFKSYGGTQLSGLLLCIMRSLNLHNFHNNVINALYKHYFSLGKSPQCLKMQEITANLGNILSSGGALHNPLKFSLRKRNGFTTNVFKNI